MCDEEDIYVLIYIFDEQDQQFLQKLFLSLRRVMRSGHQVVTERKRRGGEREREREGVTEREREGGRVGGGKEREVPEDMRSSRVILCGSFGFTISNISSHTSICMFVCMCIHVCICIYITYIVV
jgi:hypothetical protein